MSDYPEKPIEPRDGEEQSESSVPPGAELNAEDLSEPAQNLPEAEPVEAEPAAAPTDQLPVAEPEASEPLASVAPAEHGLAPEQHEPEPERPGIEELLLELNAARDRILNLSYPPTTLVLPPARAVGHRLASPVIAKSNLPLRPFATVDGLAVNANDLLLRRERDERRRGRERGRPGAAQDEGHVESRSTGGGEGGEEEQNVTREAGATALEDSELNALDLEQPQPQSVQDLDREDADNEAVVLGEASESSGPDVDSAEQRGPELTVLHLRPAPQTSRKDDAVNPGEAVPIAVGEEVPRGCDFVIPFAALEGEPASLEPPALTPEPAKWQAKDGTVAVNKGRLRDDRERQAAMRRERDKPGGPGAPAEGEPEIEDDDLPSREPPRDWELAQHYQSGTLELPRVERLGSGTLVSIGAWARNRDALMPERTLLRAGEVALLEALGIPEVEVFRRPIVGIASLSEPLPSPNRGQARREPQRRGGRATEALQMAGVPEKPAAPERPQRGRRPPPVPVEDPEEFEDLDLPSGVCPLTQMCMHLCRTAQVAALPLGYAPKRFRPLSLRMERWLNQVDVLLLVGGSHHGPRCLAQDVIATYGRLAVAGADVHPGGNLSAGSLAGKPVFAMPGSLPQVLAGFVLFVRPLLHRYITPLHFEAEIPVVLEQGSRIRFPYSTSVGLRYSYVPEKRAFVSRYSGATRGGRDSDTWMEFIRGQAIAVFEGGREYQDGDVVTAYPY